MTYEIESNVPMPASRRGRTPKYPFANMQIGDSFFVAKNIDEPIDRVRNRMLGACMWAKRKLDGDRKFIVRVSTYGEHDHYAEGVRIWRVE